MLPFGGVNAPRKVAIVTGAGRVDAVRCMAILPLDATVPFVTVLATKMPSIGRA